MSRHIKLFKNRKGRNACRSWRRCQVKAFLELKRECWMTPRDRNKFGTGLYVSGPCGITSHIIKHPFRAVWPNCSLMEMKKWNMGMKDQKSNKHG